MSEGYDGGDRSRLKADREFLESALGSFFGKDPFAGALDDFCKLEQLLEMANAWEELVSTYPPSLVRDVLATCALQVRLVVEAPVKEDSCDT